MSDPEKPDDFDLILRHVSRQFPEELARALLPKGEPLEVESASWLDTQVTSRQRRLDRALDVRVSGQRRLYHFEWELRPTAEQPFRIYEYHVLLALVMAAEARTNKRLPAPIESVLVLLSGGEEPVPDRGVYRTSPPEGMFSGVQYRVVAVYQKTVAELEALGSPFWLIFAPLATDADADKLAQVIELLRGSTAPAEFEELGVAMAVLADADRRGRGLREVVQSLLPRELVMEPCTSGVTRSLGPVAFRRPRGTVMTDMTCLVV
jgi:hypothetical protein